jgi:hypothetical protein
MREAKEVKSVTADGIPLTMETGYGEIALAADKNPNREEALKWLEDNDQGDVIKNLVKIELGKESVADAEKIVALVREHFPDVLVHRVRDAHPGTVTALANELHRKGEPFPIELFNGRERTIVRIGKPKVVK